jgi:FlgO protein
MMYRAVHLMFAVATSIAVGGCAYTGVADSMLAGTWPTEHSDLAPRAYSAVDEMLEEAPALPRSGAPVVVATISDITDVDHSTPFGNIIADMVRTRLVQRGLQVTEMRLRSSVRLNRTDGEVMLSRNPRALLRPPVAAEIVTGTYAIGHSQIFVSLKIIEADNARIVAAADFVTPRTWNIEQLLLGGVASAR